MRRLLFLLLALALATGLFIPMAAPATAADIGDTIDDDTIVGIKPRQHHPKPAVERPKRYRLRLHDAVVAELTAGA